MNFEEHCEVFVTSQGAERQRDMDILAKCLLQARAKNRAAEGLSKLTVDAPIPYALSDLTAAITHEMGLLNKATDTAPYMRLKGKIDELKSDPRYQFMFSGMLVADSMGAFITKIFRLPAKGKPISIIDVSGVPTDIVSVVVAVLSRLVFRLCDLVAQRAAEAGAPGLRGGAPLHPVRQDLERPGRPQGARADRQGRPQVRRFARPHHPAPVRSRRGRALAMRHDHRDAPQQRPRPGVRQECDAGRLARLPRHHSGAAQSRMHRLRRGASRSRFESPSTISSATAGRPRPTRCSRSCGARPARKMRWSPASSSAGAPRGGRPSQDKTRHSSASWNPTSSKAKRFQLSLE